MNFSQNLKALVFRKYVLLQLLFCVFSLSLWAQEQPRQAQPALPTQENDTTNLPQADTLQTDTLRVNLPATPQAQGDITTTINYNAKDSILFDAANRIVYLYGNAKIDYGDIKLEAAQITIDWNQSTLTAVGVKDSLGQETGKPVFTQGAETFVTDNIRYNFKNRKAVIRGVVTQQQEAYIHGNVVKKDADNQLYIRGARYTTCNLEHPHFYIEAGKLKMLPKDKIIAGPFHLRIADVPTPFGFLFGMFPVPRKRVSGVLIPTYGEERLRGFFLRDGGYYFAINENIDLALTGEIYTKGSRGFQIASNYRQRYQYGGNFSLRFNRQNAGSESNDDIRRDFWVNWSHNPESRGRNSRFSASVNFGTSSFTQNNPSINNFERNLNQQFSSSINYSNSLPGTPFNISARASMVQDIVQRTADILLPDIGLNMQRQYPFRSLGKTGRSWWEQINFSYTGAATNRITNRPQTATVGNGVTVTNAVVNEDVTPLNLDNASYLLRNANNGIRHSIPVSTTVNLFKYFAFSPSFNYQEVWYFRKLQYSDYDPATKGIRVDTVDGFSRAGSWNLSAGLNTKIYGFFYFNKKNPEPKIQAIRHLMIPSISFGYAPDFSDPRYGNFQDVVVRVDENGNETRQALSVYQGFAYGAPQAGRQGSIGFSLTNNFEMKVREKNDTAVTYKKVPLLERLSLSTSYNTLADSLKLQPISISGNTSILNNLIMINFGGRLNPYVYRKDSVNANNEVIRQSRVDQFAIATGRGLGTLEQASIGFSTSLSSQGLKGNPNREDAATTAATANRRGMNEELLGQGDPIGEDLGQQGLAYRYSDPNEYVDFTLPWSLRLNYTLSYQKTGYFASNITQSANFSGDLKITDNWKIGYSSGYDFRAHEFTATRLSIYRDLHCWQMNVNWVPFGRYQSFSLDIRVKASILQDLKLSRRRNFWDN
ncbi:putative LPS assembly protein LptD [Cesiribacter sp. SM1]|uniref:putative LPS assembly protein LptD n=1 Tax=Cesiribacter sp. SM1 TaxID=2861196 RepID=UPI001CD7A713